MPSHRCLDNGQLHYIEVTSDVDNVVGDTSKSENEDKDTVALVRGATTLLSRASKYQPFRVEGLVNGQQVTCFMDSSAAHNFVSETLVASGG